MMASVDKSGVIGMAFSGFLSFNVDVDAMGSEAVVTASSGVVTGAPIRMLSRKLSIMDSLDFMSSSTSNRNFVLLNDFIIVSPLNDLDPFS